MKTVVQDITAKVARLQKNLDDAATKMERVEALLRLAWEVKLNDPALSRSHAEELIGLLDKEELLEKRAQAWNIVGITWHVEGNIENALSSYDKAIEIYSQIDDQQLANVYINIGVAQEAIGNYRQALDYYLDSLKLMDEYPGNESTVNRATALNNIGCIYKSQGNPGHAMQYLLEALDIFEAADDANHVGNILINLSSIYIDQDEFSLALDTLAQAREIKEKSGDHYGLFEVLHNIAKVHERQLNFRKALQYQLEMLNISEKINNMHGRCRVYTNMGLLYSNLEHYAKGQDYLNKALEISEEHNYTTLTGEILYHLGANLHKSDGHSATHASSQGKESLEEMFLRSVKIAEDSGDVSRKRDAYQALVNLHEDADQLDKAFVWQKKLIELKEYLHNQEKTEAIARLNVQYETELKEKEIEKQRELNRQLSELNEQIRLQNDEITAQAEKLTAANDHLKNFAHATSHDMKEPLRMIHSFGQLLARRNRDTWDEENNQYLDFILDATRRMTNLLDDLVSYATLDKDDLRRSEVDLNDVIKSVCEDLHHKISESDAKVTMDKLPVIEANRSLMSQLFQNLINNAIKFRKDDEQPKIHIRLIEDDGDFSKMEVKDNGIGIEPQYYEKIFGIFSRLHAKDDYDGSGIGLATCKKIVEHHGGQIWLESEPGSGTSFYILLKNRQ